MNPGPTKANQINFQDLSRPWKLALETKNNQFLAMINQKALHDIEKTLGDIYYDTKIY